MADTRKSLADPNYRGEDYTIDTAIENGPLTNRRCTDILCLLIFLIATGFAGYVLVYAVENGDPELILAPMDSDGKFCGRTNGSDSTYEDYPYVFYADIDASLWYPWAVCVKKCPKEDDESFECHGTENIKSKDGLC